MSRCSFSQRHAICSFSFKDWLLRHCLNSLSVVAHPLQLIILTFISFVSWTFQRFTSFSLVLGVVLIKLKKWDIRTGLSDSKGSRHMLLGSSLLRIRCGTSGDNGSVLTSSDALFQTCMICICPHHPHPISYCSSPVLKIFDKSSLSYSQR